VEGRQTQGKFLRYTVRATDIPVIFKGKWGRETDEGFIIGDVETQEERVPAISGEQAYHLADANKDYRISRYELNVAIQDWRAGSITREAVMEVGQLWRCGQYEYNNGWVCATPEVSYHSYDTNEDNTIDRDEFNQAVRDWRSGDLTRAEVMAIGQLWRCGSYKADGDDWACA